MEKIRILRSSRKKSSVGKAKVSSAANRVPKPKPVLSESTQQWVPVLVLDITKAENTTIPSNSTLTNTNPPANCQIGGTTDNSGTKLSDPGSSDVNIPNSTVIPVPSLTVSNSTAVITDPVNNDIRSDAQLEGIISDGKNADNSVSDECREDENVLRNVKCVLCDKIFPSLKEMQVHYLGTHKSRKGREGRKRNVQNVVETSTSSSSSPSQGVNWEDDLVNASRTDTGDPICPVCRIAFKTAAEVKEHVKQVHAYVCSECNSTFYTLFQFTDHKCSKGSKRMKRVRKKGATSVTQKSEVTKVVDGHNEIKSNVKQKSKSPSGRRSKCPSDGGLNENNNCGNKKVSSQVSEPVPATVSSDSGEQSSKSYQALVPNQTINAVQINFHKRDCKKKIKQNTKTKQPSAVKQRKPKVSLNVGSNSVLDEEPFDKVKNDSSLVNASSQTSYQELHGDQVDDNDFLPSITTTYTLKEPLPDEVCETKDQKRITVIETCNIHQAKQMIKGTDSTPVNRSTQDVIKQKIAELKNNPNVSISWRPVFQPKYHDDGDFVCGRCNVICDDMEDYMDHIQDCLTMTSVILEPTSNPPRRFLRIRNEMSTFSCQELNNNRYTINQNLISKLQSVLPYAKEYLTVDSHFSKLQKSDNTVVQNTPRQAFKDLLDDDFGYESHESADLHPIGASSPVSPLEGIREHNGSVLPRSSASSAPLKDIGPVQTKLAVNSNVRVVQPMVMIPIEAKSNRNPSFSLQKDQSKIELSEKVQETVGCASNLSSRLLTSSSTMINSPLDMLLDPDEIKMEVEEEVIDDHYEGS